MVSHPSSDRFGASEAAPTTRDIARLVTAGGLAALPDATARADHATYQETRCKSALNRVQGMPFRWTLTGRMVGLLEAKYGVATRMRTPLDPETPAPSAPEPAAQASFHWPRLLALARPGR